MNSPVIGELKANNLCDHQSILQRQTRVGLVDGTLKKP
jgi:hypothetical protein